MIYSHKPQRSGRSIPTISNTPPQDPPAPPIEIPEIIPVEVPVIPEIPEIPDVLIEDSTPPVLDEIIHESPKTIDIPVETITDTIEKPKQKSWLRRILSKIIFWKRH